MQRKMTWKGSDRAARANWLAALAERYATGLMAVTQNRILGKFDPASPAAMQDGASAGPDRRVPLRHPMRRIGTGCSNLDEADQPAKTKGRPKAALYASPGKG
jgi:hypothetical protein